MLVHWEDPEGWDGEGGGRGEGGSGMGIHVNPWLIHVNVWQKPLQYCKVISLKLRKINGGKKKQHAHTLASSQSNSNNNKAIITECLLVAQHVQGTLFTLPPLLFTMLLRGCT